MAVKTLTKDHVILRTGTFLHKTELHRKKVRPRIILSYQSIAEVFNQIVGEYVMKAYTVVRGVYQVFVSLEVIMEPVHFICHQELWGKEKKTKQKLSKLHSELKQDGESQKYYVSLNLILVEFKTDTTTDIQVGLRLLLSNTVIIRSGTKSDWYINITHNTNV
jgi:hypothetical protein